MTNQQHPQKTADFWGQQIVINCDRQCNKAFGMNDRPSVPGIGVYVGDDELGEASPFIYFTDIDVVSKPSSPDQFPNEWCIRACERGRWRIIEDNEAIPNVKPPIFPSIYYLVTADGLVLRPENPEQEEIEHTLLKLVLPLDVVEVLRSYMMIMSPMQADKVMSWANERLQQIENGYSPDYPSWLFALIDNNGEADDTIIPDIDEDDENDYPTDHQNSFPQ